MIVYVLIGISVDGAECIGVFQTMDSLNKTLSEFDNTELYTKNPYDDFEIVEKRLE